MDRPISGRNIRGSVDSYRPIVCGEDTRLRELMAEWPLLTDDRYGCYLIPGSSRHSDLARGIESSVFQHFFGNDPSVMSAEYGPYEDASLFLFVVDQEQERPAGTMRLIRNSERGFKTLNDIERPPLSIPLARVTDCHRIDKLDKVWDIATVAVLKEYRGKASNHLVSTLLYGAMFAEAQRVGVDHFVAIMDEHVFSQLTGLAVPFVPIAKSPPFDYLGSQSSRAGYLFGPNVRPNMEAFMQKLDENVLQLVRPCLARMAFAEGIPDPIRVT